MKIHPYLNFGGAFSGAGQKEIDAFLGQQNGALKLCRAGCIHEALAQDFGAVQSHETVGGDVEDSLHFAIIFCAATELAGQVPGLE